MDVSSNSSFGSIWSLVEKMPGNYMVFQAKGGAFRQLYYTEGVPALSGCTPEEYRAVADPISLVLDEDRLLITSRVQEYAATGNTRPIDLLFRLIHRKKGFVWVHMTAKELRLPDAPDEPLYLVSLLDVTKETMISYALMEASNQYICVIEKATKRILYGNSAFFDLVDSCPAEAMGKHCYELLCKTPAMRTCNDCLCYSSLNANPPVETYNPVKDKYISMTGREVIWGEYDAYVFYLTDITERKRKDEQLLDSQKRFEVALANSDLMIWEYDIVNSRCIASQKAERDYGIPLIIENYPESLYEMGHTPPETVAQIKEVKRRLLNGETGFSVERRTIDKYGKSQWQKVEYTLECDAAGKPLRAIVCGMDITARKELERKYEAQMEYRNNLARNAAFSIRLDLDSDSISDYTSSLPVLEEIARASTSASDFLTKFFATSQFEKNCEITRETFTLSALKNSHALGRSQYQTTYQCGLLHLYLHLNLTIYKNPGTGHREVFYVITDVTENMLMQRAFQNVVGQDYDFVATINPATGKVLFLVRSPSTAADHGTAQHTGDYDELVQNFSQLHRNVYHSEEDFRAASEGIRLSTVLEKLAAAPTYEFNCKVRNEQGEINIYHLSFSYSDQTKTQIVFTRANITHVVQEEQQNQKALEAALKATRQADRAKTEFLSRMSHDMRTPMNGIIGMTRLTQDIPGLPAEVQHNLAAIEDSSDYLLRLINDTLDMNKIESNRFTLNPEEVNTGELLEHIISAITPLVNQKQIRLSFVPLNTAPDYIRADRRRVQQLLLNILSNAVKFTPVGGIIRVEAECLKRENGRIYDRISVEDNGCGMSEDYLNHIYEPFSQERTRIVSGQEGTGLGMSIVKNLVELMGGRIEIASRQGAGTKVTVYLSFPLVEGTPSQPRAPLHRAEAELSGKRVLLAEDHPLNATIARRLLEKKGMLVEHAENGAATVEMFAASAPGYYDAILMDIRMPELDGLAATRAIRLLARADAKTVPILAMTANAYAEDVQTALEAGMNAHLAKPIDPEMLYQTLETYL